MHKECLVITQLRFQTQTNYCYQYIRRNKSLRCSSICFKFKWNYFYQYIRRKNSLSKSRISPKKGSLSMRLMMMKVMVVVLLVVMIMMILVVMVVALMVMWYWWWWWWHWWWCDDDTIDSVVGAITMTRTHEPGKYVKCNPSKRESLLHSDSIGTRTKT